MKKIVVLNSGGFDSTTLLADLASKHEYEIHSLYFDYGQLNCSFDSKCAKENAKKLGAIHHELILPKFNWTHSDFYYGGNNNYSTQYLEMRNVIFISYALSLAEGIGAESIYMALLANGNYKDTNPRFIEKMKSLCDTLGISFETPYSDCIKLNLFYTALKLGVGTELKYISCDTPNPINGEPCGKCDDCKSLEYYNYLLTQKDIPSIFVKSGYRISSEFEEAFKSEPIYEMRVLLNNNCQLKCEHCYHGNNTLVADILTDEELVNAIVEARNLGVRSIHFAGKEPLFNERIFKIIRGVKSRNINDLDFSVVTNGINVPKYADKIVDSGISKVFLSADDEFIPQGIHKQNSAVKKAIKSLNGRVNIEIFYDLTIENIKHTIENILFWNSCYNVKSFYVRTIRLVGSAEENKIELLSVEQICKLHKELKNLQELDLQIMLNIGAAPYVYNIFSSNEKCVEEIKEDFDILNTLKTLKVTDIYSLYFELYCHRYCDTITLTADGFILGCAMECSVQEYDSISAGNIKNKPLEELISIGKQKSIEVNRTQCTKDDIFFEKCLFTPIDF